MQNLNKKSNDLVKANILSMYTNTDELQKGGKPAVVGEVRTWNNQKWVKHQDGWVLFNQKTGNHVIEKDGKRTPAEPHHVEHARKYLQEHERETGESLGEGELSKENIESGKRVSKTSPLHSQLLDVVDSYSSGMGEKHKLEVDRLQHLREKHQEYLDKFKEKLPKLTQILEKNGFKIEKLTLNKTGSNREVWSDDDYLHSSFTLTPTKNNLSFYSHQGYDRDGAGRNRRKLGTQALKLNTILNESGLKFSSNPFSFENVNRRGEDTGKRVLVDFWVQ